MSLEPRGSDGSLRQSILQGVYEDNLRIDRPSEAKRRVRPAPPAAEERRRGPARPAASRAAPPPAARSASARSGSVRAAPWKRVAVLGAALCFVLALGAAGVAYWQGVWAPRAAASSASAPAGEASRQASAVAGGGDGHAVDSFAVPGAVPGDSAAFSAAAGAAATSLTAAGGTRLSVAQLFGLEVRTIVIDPGHGGEEAGAVGAEGTREKDVVLDVARRLRSRLEQRGGYRILMTREWDKHVPLKERVAFANRQGADLFVSIHVNSLPVERVTSIETYYFGSPADGPSLRMARRENADSEYSLAEFNDALDNTRNALRLQESKRLATSIQKNLYRNMRTINENVSDWGVKTAPFVVLMGTEAPSVLAEIAVITNRAEEAQLSQSMHRENLAMFLEQGIVDYLNGEAPDPYSAAASPTTAE